VWGPPAIITLPDAPAKSHSRGYWSWLAGSSTRPNMAVAVPGSAIASGSWTLSNVIDSDSGGSQTGRTFRAPESTICSHRTSNTLGSDVEVAEFSASETLSSVPFCWLCLACCAAHAPSPLTATEGTTGTVALGPSLGGAYGDDTRAALNRSKTVVSTFRYPEPGSGGR